MASQKYSGDARLQVQMAPPAQSPAIGADLVPRKGVKRPVLAAPAQSKSIGVSLVPRKGLPHPLLAPPAQSPPL